MPDISMCPGTNCAKRNDCYRYRAIPNEYRQSYLVTAPITEEGECDYFWQADGYRVRPIEEINK